MNRVSADGKHLELEGQPFRVRGVTYGSFLPRLDGEPWPDHSQIKRDFTEIEAVGLNVVRTYELPSEEILDLAAEVGLRLIVGLHFEDWRYEPSPGRRAHRRVRDAGRRAVAEAMARCAGRPEVLAVSVGNEVPADVVRVHGIGRVQETLSMLVEEVHAADPDMLAAYCNFPTTEYLEVAGQDLVCFNVFLEDPDAFRRYVRHLQVVSGDLPLVLTELGLAARPHGEGAQAEALSWQLGITDEASCAGATIFSWTDEWGVAGEAVESWGFGITDAERNPKPALRVASTWARSTIRDLRSDWPRISAVVCAYNGEQLMAKCLSSLRRCDYPNLEVIVCDDGSTDRTLEIARQFPFKVLELDRGGLSAARNAGIAASTGEIVAFIDADAYCHPEWPYHLALSMEDAGVVATGGPNLPVEDARLVERAVASSPGGPVHVLVSDDRAEHVPGCNMAYRKDALEAIGGFDPIYASAGDDVDVCWKLLDRGEEIAFSPAAQVRHHRRDTMKGYLRQQHGYGRAEQLLSQRHPHRFNRLGQAKWAGVIYGAPRMLPSVLKPVVYHGYWGQAPYQGVVHRPSEIASHWGAAILPLGVALFGVGLALGLIWAPLFVIVAAATLLVVGYGVAVAIAAQPTRSHPRPTAFRGLVAFMHVAQPLVRLWGRLRAPRSRTQTLLFQAWTGDRATWLQDLRRRLEAGRCAVIVAGPHESWDLQAALGPFVACRVTTAVTWSWTPLRRLSLRLRWSVGVAIVGVGIVAIASTSAGIVTAGMLALVIGGETLALRRIVVRAVKATIEGAKA